MYCFFTNQVLGQLACWKVTQVYKKDVYLLPEKVDEKVAAVIPRLGR